MADYQQLWEQMKQDFLVQEIEHREKLLETHPDSEHDIRYRWENELNMLKMVLKVMLSAEKYS